MIAITGVTKMNFKSAILKSAILISILAGSISAHAYVAPQKSNNLATCARVELLTQTPISAFGVIRLHSDCFNAVRFTFKGPSGWVSHIVGSGRYYDTVGPSNGIQKSLVY